MSFMEKITINNVRIREGERENRIQGGFVRRVRWQDGWRQVEGPIGGEGGFLM